LPEGKFLRSLQQLGCEFQRIGRRGRRRDLPVSGHRQVAARGRTLAGVLRGHDGGRARILALRRSAVPGFARTCGADRTATPVRSIAVRAAFLRPRAAPGPLLALPGPRRSISSAARADRFGAGDRHAPDRRHPARAILGTLPPLRRSNDHRCVLWPVAELRLHDGTGLCKLSDGGCRAHRRADRVARAARSRRRKRRACRPARAGCRLLRTAAVRRPWSRLRDIHRSRGCLRCRRRTAVGAHHSVARARPRTFACLVDSLDRARVRDPCGVGARTVNAHTTSSASWLRRRS
jgi:hypothetical protein